MEGRVRPSIRLKRGKKAALEGIAGGNGRAALRARGWTRRAGWAAGILMLGGVCGLYSGSMTLTTYYPAPFGVYEQLRSTKEAFLAYGSPTARVGIGTTEPRAKLDVRGISRLSDVDIDGDLRILSGSPGEGKVLMSDPHGRVSWQPPPPPDVVLRQAGMVQAPNAHARVWHGIAQCPADRPRIIGGGVDCSHPSGRPTAARVLANRPALGAGPQGWHGACVRRPGTVYAFCSTGAPPRAPAGRR